MEADNLDLFLLPFSDRLDEGLRTVLDSIDWQKRPKELFIAAAFSDTGERSPEEERKISDHLCRTVLAAGFLHGLRACEPRIEAAGGVAICLRYEAAAPAVTT
jgi:hypothetical protein